MKIIKAHLKLDGGMLKLPCEKYRRLPLRELTLADIIQVFLCLTHIPTHTGLDGSLLLTELLWVFLTQLLRNIPTRIMEHPIIRVIRRVYHLSSIRGIQRIPSLSGLDSELRHSILVACVVAKTQGPASYIKCLNLHLRSIGIAPN